MTLMLDFKTRTLLTLIILVRIRLGLCALFRLILITSLCFTFQDLEVEDHDSWRRSSVLKAEDGGQTGVAQSYKRLTSTLSPRLLSSAIGRAQAGAARRLAARRPAVCFLVVNRRRRFWCPERPPPCFGPRATSSPILSVCVTGRRSGSPRVSR